ncbi:MAG: phenylalanine--tRNA ligase subunit alpha [Candidatus Saccharibacteria bacterium]|nr:phenylalanine--tRNA ligase subunit alpha [Candidatus Saccharibacteria bacterium]
MSDSVDQVQKKLTQLISQSTSPREALRSSELKSLYAELPKLPVNERSAYGQKINNLKQKLETAVNEREESLAQSDREPIDVTAPFDINAPSPDLLPTGQGTTHPLNTELANVIDIFTRMGFAAVESRQIDDDYHMFTSLNFPENHPARDGYDTFRTSEGLVPPAHTSTMQNRILKAGKKDLENGGQIAAISYGRVFRNEDLDATHEHTFYQVEGIFVSSDANLAQMMGTLRSFFEVYYGQKLKTKTQPAYFPFVEPGLEFAIEKPAALGGKPGEWLEMLGCGMIHPNVLREAGIDSAKYRGFAWGGGVERLVMLKYGIEDLRHFESGKLAFLRKFA